MFTIDFNNHEPLYIQIAEDIKKRILSGNINKGDKLPSKRSLSNHLGVSVNTISNAYDSLLAEGYLESKERRGYFVMSAKELVRIPLVEFFEEEEKVKYDFIYSGVDSTKFPHSIFRSISRGVFTSEKKSLLHLNEREGSRSLRKAIKEYLLSARGFDVPIKNIIVSAGTEYLFKILFNLLDDEFTFAIEDPGYEKLDAFFRQNNRLYKSVKVSDKGMDFDLFLKSKADVVFLTPSHQFPTGVIMPASVRNQFLNWANEGDRYIIEDDYDSEFKYRGRVLLPIKAMDERDRVIYMGNFSKSIAPSFRTSYMCLPDSLLKKFEELSFTTCPVSPFIQEIIAEFINKGNFEKHLNRMRTLYKRKREKLLKAISREFKDYEISQSDSGLHIILKLSKVKKTEEEIIKCLRREEIKIDSINRFYTDKKPLITNSTITFLLGFGTIEIEDIDEGIKALRRAVLGD